jgi:hypothetical protein
MAALSAWLATARTRLADLGLVESDGLLDVEAEPLALDRRFEIVGVEVGTTQARLGTDAVQRLGRVEVVVVFDGGPDRAQAFGRIFDEAAAIIDSLETSHAGVVQRVTSTGSSIQPRQGHGFTLRIPFDVLYLDT